MFNNKIIPHAHSGIPAAPANHPASPPPSAPHAVPQSHSSSGHRHSCDRPVGVMQGGRSRHPAFAIGQGAESLLDLAKRIKLKCLHKQGNELQPEDLLEARGFLIGHFEQRASRGADIKLLSDFLGEVDSFFNELASLSGRRFQRARYDVKKSALASALEKTAGKPLTLVAPYRELPHYKGKNTMLASIARREMEQAVKAQFGLPDKGDADAVRRLTRNALTGVNQGEYILHVCHLFNLGRQISGEDQGRFLTRIGSSDRATMHALHGRRDPLTGTRFKDAIPYLLNCFPIDGRTRDRISRNAHPASLMLQLCSGFVFHPGYDNKALVDTKSPYSFENISDTLAYKYFEEKHHEKLPEFFESAFARENACYEAVAEQLMNFTPASGHAADQIFHPQPAWNDALCVEDNVGGMLAWVERELLKDYAKEKSIDLEGCSLRQVGMLESSKEYATYMIEKEGRINRRLRKATEGRVPGDVLARLVREDLALGLASSR